MCAMRTYGWNAVISHIEWLKLWRAFQSRRLLLAVSGSLPGLDWATSILRMKTLCFPVLDRAAQMRLSLMRLRSSMRRKALTSGEMIDFDISLHAVICGECQLSKKLFCHPHVLQKVCYKGQIYSGFSKNLYPPWQSVSQSAHIFWHFHASSGTLLNL